MVAGVSARKPIQDLTRASNAAADWADRGKRWQPSATAVSVATGESFGASSTMTFELVPPTPNELTAAQRGKVLAGSGVIAVGTASRVPVSEMCGLSFVKWGCGGTSP